MTSERSVVRVGRKSAWGIGAFVAASFALATAAGCTWTEFYNEGPGQPYDRATAAVPIGMVGVCRRAFTKRPPIVSPSLWEHARLCKSDTPKEYIRLGYGQGNSEEAARKIERMMTALREGPKEQAGNTAVLAMLRAIRAEGLNDKWLKDRVSRESARTSVCDFSYLLNTMESESAKLRGGDKCAVYAYDQVDKKETCLFDTNVNEAVWLTGAWACMTRTGSMGQGESCHKLCAYDDYCARQVSCAAPDVDLALCAMGVCLPEPDGLGM
jgi:hypothetical protein